MKTRPGTGEAGKEDVTPQQALKKPGMTCVCEPVEATSRIDQRFETVHYHFSLRVRLLKVHEIGQQVV